MGYWGFATSFWEIILGMSLFFSGKRFYNCDRQDGKRHQDHEVLIAAFYHISLGRVPSRMDVAWLRGRHLDQN
jgi:hypothetical protein